MRKNRIFQRNDLGFSLVGILVGVSLLGILTLGMTQVFSNMLKNQNYNKFRSQVENFGEELRAQLGSKEICTATLGHIPLSSTANLNIPAIKNQAGDLIYKTGVDLGDHSFVIVSMDLKGGSSPWYIDDNPTAGIGRIILTVNYRATAEQSGPKDYFRTYTLATHRDPAFNLIDCAAQAKMTDGIWRYNQATSGDIYYSGGNVGLGTLTPTSTLQVLGSLSINLTIKSTSAVLADSENVIMANAAGAALTLTLPSATGITGRQYSIKKVDTSGHAVTVSAGNGQLIDGAASFVLTTPYKFVTVITDGSNWNVIGTNQVTSSLAFHVWSCHCQDGPDLLVPTNQVGQICDRTPDSYNNNQFSFQSCTQLQ